MKYAYYPGCVTPQRENNYELSARKVAEKLGIEFVDLKGESCCGFFLGQIDYLSSAIMSAYNLSLADQSGLDLLTLCVTCAGHLIRVRKELLEDRKLRDSVNEALGRINLKFTGSADVKHLARVLTDDVKIENIRSTIVKPLKTLKVAPHYGCHIVKPSDTIQFDSPENPKLLDSLIAVTGAKLVDYMEKKLCCGAPVMVVDDKLSVRVVRDKLKNIKESGADLIVTLCPFCHTQYDLNQSIIEEEYSEEYNIPVLHYTQLLGLAQGITFDDLGLYENRVPADDVLAAFE